MTFATKLRLKSILLFCAVFAMLPGLASAQSDSEPATQAAQVSTTGWGVQCNNVGADLQCSALISLVATQTNQLILRISIQRQAENDDHMLLVQLPLGLNLPRGIDMIVDDGEAQTLVINTCIPAGCFVTHTLDQAQLDAMKAGNTVAVVMASNDGNENRIEMPLSGFTKSVEKLQ